MIRDFHFYWQEARVKFVLKLFEEEYFKNKTVLELAPCNGYIGNEFLKLGSIVTGIEGRQEHCDVMKEEVPGMTIICADLDTPDWPWGRFDVIINWGLYYHLEKYHRDHLINCIKNCDLLLFESVIYDSPNPELIFRDEIGPEQSLSDKGGSPSTSYMENIFKECNKKFTKYSPLELSVGGHDYTWEDGTYLNEQPVIRRRFWVVQ